MATGWSRSYSAVFLESRKSNPLRQYFNSIENGKGIWKWDHYFDIYHRHLQKFVGLTGHIAEVGVYSGGSLGMWHFYFGPGCHVYGIDSQPECMVYEGEHTRIFIGDQADRSFWRHFRENVPLLDVLIDDGGHRPEQQIATLEEILPHLRPGGVYICEDITGIHNRFATYVSGLSATLNAFDLRSEGRVFATPFQRSIGSIHMYPFVVVIERSAYDIKELRGERRGSEWQPFIPR
jgi:hypothetical protein